MGIDLENKPYVAPTGFYIKVLMFWKVVDSL